MKKKSTVSKKLDKIFGKLSKRGQASLDSIDVPKVTWTEHIPDELDKLLSKKYEK